MSSTSADGTQSETRRYSFYANLMTPQMSCDTNGFVHPGQEVHCTFTTPQPNVASFRYRLDGHQETTVPAAADGTAAMSFTVPADQTSTQISLYLSSVNTSGLTSDELSTGFPVDLGSGTAERRAHAL